MKAYETWSHLLVQECGKAELLPYDQVEASLAFYEKGGNLYRVTCRGVYPESPMCLDIAPSFRDRRNRPVETKTTSHRRDSNGRLDAK